MDNSRIDESVIDYPLNSTQTPDATLSLPTLVTRIKALVIDVLILLLIFTGTTLFINLFGGAPDFLKGFIFVFMVYLYDPLLTTFMGSTLGHRFMGMKVRSYSNLKSKISFPRAFLRFVIKSIFGWLSFLTVTMNKEKRAIHDLASGSIVLLDK